MHETFEAEKALLKEQYENEKGSNF